VRLLTNFNNLISGAAGTLVAGTDFSTPDGGVIVRFLRFDAASETALVRIFKGVSPPPIRHTDRPLVTPRPRLR